MQILFERYVEGRLRHSVILVVKLVDEYKAGFESRCVEYPSSLLSQWLRLKKALDVTSKIILGTKVIINSQLLKKEFFDFEIFFSSLKNVKRLTEHHVRSNFELKRLRAAFFSLFKFIFQVYHKKVVKIITTRANRKLLQDN
ncbi:hypothetical protein BpHYR1_054380 [Brachionus plicatilis]|uniref:Uncharacterized protein n=1 Tax=Brachionus plicatilis TaxID=10195 RepID=A0A3M7QIM1_BRAPC|nr:hypothetical protein BpHYR1_054380 [Brachionus plicatilis]